MQALRFSHLGLFVRDVDAMAAFYRDVFGFVETDRGILDERLVIFLSRDPDEHHQLIFFSGLSAPPPEAIINQISFRLETLESLLAFHAEIAARGAGDIRPINHGNAWSIYFRDPEDNRLEAYVPTPWYIVQPCREPLDVTQSPAVIRAATETWCRAQPTFEPAAAFSARIADRLRAAAPAAGRP